LGRVKDGDLLPETILGQGGKSSNGQKGAAGRAGEFRFHSCGGGAFLGGDPKTWEGLQGNGPLPKENVFLEGVREKRGGIKGHPGLQSLKQIKKDVSSQRTEESGMRPGGDLGLVLEDFSISY